MNKCTKIPRLLAFGGLVFPMVFPSLLGANGNGDEGSEAEDPLLRVSAGFHLRGKDHPATSGDEKYEGSVVGTYGLENPLWTGSPGDDPRSVTDGTEEITPGDFEDTELGGSTSAEYDLADEVWYGAWKVKVDEAWTGGVDDGASIEVELHFVDSEETLTLTDEADDNVYDMSVEGENRGLVNKLVFSVSGLGVRTVTDDDDKEHEVGNAGAYIHVDAYRVRKEEDGGAIVGVIHGLEALPRPTGLIERLYLNATDNFNPSDGQILYDTVAEADPSVFSQFNFGGRFPLPLALVNFFPTDGFTLTNLTPADREYLTLLFLSNSNDNEPAGDIKENNLASIDGRLINRLRFTYGLANNAFLENVFDILVSRGIPGDTPVRIPLEENEVLKIRLSLGNSPIIQELSWGFSVSGTLSGNLPVDPPTGVNGGAGEDFIENLLYVRAGPALNPTEQAILGFQAPAFFSEMRFEIDTENVEGKLIYEYVVGHSNNPEFTWPEFHVYRWTDEGDGENDFVGYRRLDPGGKKSITNSARGPFPGFINAEEQEAGPSDTHRLLSD